MKQLLRISTQLASPRDPRGPLQSLPVAVPAKRYPVQSVEFGTQIPKRFQFKLSFHSFLKVSRCFP